MSLPTTASRQPRVIRPSTSRPLLYCKDMGTSGPLLVFLPGVGGTTRYWERRVAPLAAGHRILLLDLLGFGKSPKPWVRYTVDRQVTELHRVLRGRGPTTLVGHSFGGIAALAYAAHHPRNVTGLVLMGLPCFGSLERARAHYRAVGFLEGWLLTNLILAAVTCIVTRRILRRALPRLLSDLPREVAEDLVQHTWLSSTSTMWNGVYRYDPTRDADRLPATLPVLLLHGDRDLTAPLDGVRRLAAARREWKTHILSGVDHHPMLRDPTACRDAIAAFVTNTADPGLLATATHSDSSGRRRTTGRPAPGRPE